MTLFTKLLFWIKKKSLKIYKSVECFSLLGIDMKGMINIQIQSLHVITFFSFSRTIMIWTFYSSNLDLWNVFVKDHFFKTKYTWHNSNNKQCAITLKC